MFTHLLMVSAKLWAFWFSKHPSVVCMQDAGAKTFAEPKRNCCSWCCWGKGLLFCSSTPFSYVTTSSLYIGSRAACHLSPEGNTQAPSKNAEVNSFNVTDLQLSITKQYCLASQKGLSPGPFKLPVWHCSDKDQAEPRGNDGNWLSRHHGSQIWTFRKIRSSLLQVLKFGGNRL